MSAKIVALAARQASDELALKGAKVDAIASTVQRGIGTLVAGTFTISSGITITANSVITLSRRAQFGTVTSTVQYEAPVTERVVGGPGVGAFTAQASLAAGGVNAADLSELDWAISG